MDTGEMSTQLAPRSVANISGDSNHLVQIGQSYGTVNINLHNGANSGSRRAGGRVCSLPFPPNEKFVGRSEDVNLLYQKLIHDGPSRAALSGLGGIGKTQIALAFAYKVKLSCPSRSIFWIPLTSAEATEQAFKKAGRLLDLHSTKDQSVAETVCEFLSCDASGEWLLILDNVDSKAVLDDSNPPLGDLLPHSDHGSILITTRNREVAYSIASTVIDIDEMSEVTAREMFDMSMTFQPKDPDHIPELLRELTYLPLAISQAAAYITNTRITIARYLTLLKGPESGIKLLSRNIDDRTRYRKSSNAVASTWLVSFEQIEAENDLAIKILGLMSYIEAKAIPRAILFEPDSENTISALGVLSSYRFITENTDSDTFDLHRLVHLISGVWMQDQKIVGDLKLGVLQHIESVFPKPGPENIPLWRKLIPHALRLLSGSVIEDPIVKMYLGIKTAVSLILDGRPKDALSISKKVQQGIAHLSEDDDRRLELNYHLSVCHEWNHQYQEAITLLEHDYPQWKTRYPETNILRLSVELHLAAYYSRVEQHEQSIELLEHVTNTFKMVTNEYDPNRLRAEYELADAQLARGSKEALVNIEHVVQTMKQCLHEEHLDRLAAEHLLAWAQMREGQYERALKTIERVVEIRQRIQNETHLNRLLSELALAKALHLTGQFERALRIIERVVELGRRTLNETDRNQVRFEHMLAISLCSTGRFEQALEVIEPVCEMRKKTLDENHPDLLAAEQILALCFHSTGQSEKALELSERVVGLGKQTLDETHPDLLSSEHTLAVVLQTRGRCEEALDIIRHVVEIESRIHGPSHPFRLSSVGLYEELLFEVEKQGQASDAISQ